MKQRKPLRRTQTRRPVDYARPLDDVEAAAMYADGIGIKAIARHFRVDVKRVRTAIAGQGVPIRSHGRPSSKVTGEAQARRAVRQRSGGTCEVCGTAPARDWHHRKNRSQGGLWEAANGLALCREDHRVITDNPHDSAQKGWTVWSYQDPATTPVYRRGEWVLLDTEGGWESVNPEAVGGAA